MKELVIDVINDPECLPRQMFDIKRIKEMFSDHLNGNNRYTEWLYLLVTFGVWHKKYGP